MRREKRDFFLTSVFALLLFLFLCSAQPRRLQAQNIGDNAVYGPSSMVTNSKAFIDASTFTTSAGGPAGANDLCGVLKYIYSNGVIPALGAVIDARGIAAPSTCSVNPWPLSGVPPQPIAQPPTTILLPSGSINIPSTWIVASGTHLIGQRRTTNLNPTSGFTAGTFMIQMGPSSSCTCPASGCPPVVLEYITIQDTVAMPAYVSGIDNECSGPGSYVDHIIMFDVAGTGIKVGTNAGGSGPYTNINYSSGSYCSTDCSHASCVQLSAPTRGVHGITCTLQSNMLTGLTNAGILIDAPNTSIEDIHLEGFVDGVLVGDTASASGSSLLHITGGNGGMSSGPLQNSIRICNPTSHHDLCQSTAPLSSDITISQVGNNTNTGLLIQDDLTNTSVGVPPGSSVEFTGGLYVVGESTGGGYSRFSTTTTTHSSQTTTPATPAWGVAALSTGQTPPTPCPVGSIFSNTSGSGSSGTSNTIYVCLLSAGSPIWSAVTNN